MSKDNANNKLSKENAESNLNILNHFKLDIEHISELFADNMKINGYMVVASYNISETENRVAFGLAGNINDVLTATNIGLNELEKRERLFSDTDGKLH